MKIPFEYKSNFILITVVLDNRLPLKFLFDSGAEHTLLFKRTYADILNLEFEEKVITVMGSDLSIDLYAFISRQVPIKTGASATVNHDILVLDSDYNELDHLAGVQIDGILGANYFKNYVVEIDYGRKYIQLWKKEALGKMAKKYHSIDIVKKSNKAYIPSTVWVNEDETVETLFLLDTGAGLNLMLHTNTHEMFELPNEVISGTVGTGLGGRVTGHLGRISKFSFGDDIYEDIIISYQDLDSILINSDLIIRNGILGNQLLRRYHLFINYPDEMLYYHPNKFSSKKVRFDKSGLTIFAAGPLLDEFVIRAVIPGSASDRAGLQEGDVIIRLQGLSSSMYTLSGIINMFTRKSGKKIKMKVRRDGQILQKKFRLEDLI